MCVGDSRYPLCVRFVSPARCRSSPELVRNRFWTVGPPLGQQLGSRSEVRAIPSLSNYRRVLGSLTAARARPSLFALPDRGTTMPPRRVLLPIFVLFLVVAGPPAAEAQVRGRVFEPPTHLSLPL